uniref:C-type lectin domain-containing protein n=1 Tax=Acrobeloides nanus TaxID=290746 RepID=A0A914CM40_9BILA
MSNPNLRKLGTTLSLIMSKFTIGNQADTTKGYRNTRISVITYDTNAKIAANFSSINGVNDLANVLNGLSASASQNANLEDALVKAYEVKFNCNDSASCQFKEDYPRPTALVLFAAGAISTDISTIERLLLNFYIFAESTLITVNFNSANQALSNFLNGLTYDDLMGTSEYNYTSSSSTLTRDLEWAMLQANCYCGELGTNVMYIDKSNNNRVTKYAECLIMEGWLTEEPNDVFDMCSMDNDKTRTPAYILSSEKLKFIQAIWDDHDYYIGLHKNNQSQWVWYNYDRTEFMLSGFSDWGVGQPNGTDGCVIFDSTNNGNLVWKTITCDTDSTGITNALCQSLACDATNTYCITSTGSKKKEKSSSKRLQLKDPKKFIGKKHARIFA